MNRKDNESMFIRMSKDIKDKLKVLSEIEHRSATEEISYLIDKRYLEIVEGREI